MALGLTRRTRAHPVDLENLAYAAYEFREALIPLHGITPDRCDAAATAARDSALVAEERFFAAVAGLPRRERALAGHWENAAVMRYRYGLEVFARAEDLGADMLAQRATHRRPSLPALTELCDACTHARTLDQHQRPEMFGAIARKATRRLRTAPGDSARRRPRSGHQRSCLVDQAELRWRIRRDLTGFSPVKALAGDEITREAERHLVPWLKLACETLDSPMSIDGPEDVAAQWRERRRPYMLAAADRADVIIVDRSLVSTRPCGGPSSTAMNRRHRCRAASTPTRCGDVSSPQFIPTFCRDRRCNWPHGLHRTLRGPSQ
ncbi:hypothetical protein [Rhodococcus jostii]|uniref:hypothetical protein n=1 Tax=Rhodococcus jostii TaxID=132919 RepID=UPI003646FB70